jgi:hypothetical protein
MSCARLLALLACIFVWAGPARADEPRPLYVEATETAAGTYDLAWRMPPNFSPGDAPDLVLPAGCLQDGPTLRRTDVTGHWQRKTVRCEPTLAGRAIRTAYPNGNPGLGTIFKTTALEGRSDIALELPQQRALVVPAAGTPPSSVFMQYTRLGIEHIWMGFDHLLFAACLVWIAGTIKRILITITGFTLAHSLTLTLASLGLVRVPVAAVEAIIALSIVFLAIELAKGPRNTLTWRHPIAVSSSFGLLHGFGFASVLAEIGLPQGNLIAALFSFNLGIEIGQAIFVFCVVGAVSLLTAAASLLRRRKTHWHPNPALAHVPRLGVAYGVGTLASLWMLQRVAGA